MIQFLRQWVLPVVAVACVGVNGGCSLATNAGAASSDAAVSAGASEPQVSVEELQARRRAAAVEAAKATTVDTEAPGFSLLNPCGEITDEALAPINLTWNHASYYEAEAARFCSLRLASGNPLRGTLLVQSDIFNAELFQRENAFHGYLEDPEIPGAFLTRYGDAQDIDDNCTVSIMTPRGRFSVQHAGTWRKNGRVEDCPRAIEYFKQVYQLPATQDALYGSLESYR